MYRRLYTQRYKFVKVLVLISAQTPYSLGLLNNIGTHINPKQLIANIPNGQKIPGLRDSLVKILCDYNLQVNNVLGLQWGQGQSP